MKKQIYAQKLDQNTNALCEFFGIQPFMYFGQKQETKAFNVLSDVASAIEKSETSFQALQDRIVALEQEITELQETE